MVARFPARRIGVALLAMLILTPLPRTAATRPVAPAGPRPAQAVQLQAEPSVDAPDGREDAATGALRSRFALSYRPRPGAPEAMAREYLSAAAGELGMAPDLADLQVVKVQQGLGTRHVRFRQTWRGVPVYASDVVVSLRDADGAVAAVTSDYKSGVALPDAVPAVSAGQAEAIALRTLAPRDAAPPRKSQLVVWSREGRHRLAWRVAVLLADPLGNWEVFVDARSGESFQVRDRMCYAHGLGYVFHPDPISTVGAPYGTGGFADNGDANNADLANQRFWVPLYDITEVPGPEVKYRLAGPACVIQDFPGDDGLPLGDDVVAYEQNNPDGFNYTRDDQGFEAVMVYAHITDLQYWIQLIGFTNANNDQDPADPHAVGGADNSFYSPDWDALAFGEGGVDDAEDAGVIAHEYGHALQADQVPDWGQFNEGTAMGEGFGDYLAGSYVGAYSSYQSNWAMKWDGPIVSGSPGLRSLTSGKTYPTSLIYEPHADGEIWSDALWAIHGALGRVLTDQLVIQSHFYLTPGATFRDGALAILQADTDITGGVNQGLLQGILAARGLLNPGLFPVVALAGSDQARPAIAFDRDPGNYGNSWGRHLLVAWQDDRNGPPGETFARRVRASGTLRAPELNLGGFQDPDIACAPLQDWPDSLKYIEDPEFLVVGAQQNATSDIVGELVRSRDAAVTVLPVVAANPAVDEVRPAADAVDSTYLVGYLVDDGTGSPFVQAQLLDEDGILQGGPIPLASPPMQLDLDVAGGYDPVSGNGEFLVVWSKFDFTIPRSYVEARRVDRNGIVLDAVPVEITATHPFFEGQNFTPAVAFDGNTFLVVWQRHDAVTGMGEIWGRYLSAFDGSPVGAQFLIGPAPAMRDPDVAFDGRQYLVVWNTEPTAPNEHDVLGVRIDPFTGILDPAPLAIAATALRERLPRVTAVSGREPWTAGRGFCVAWSQTAAVDPEDNDVWAQFVPDSFPVVSPPSPLTLGVLADGFPDDAEAPGDTADLIFTVENTGTRKDGYRLTAIGTKVTWTHIVHPMVVLEPSEVAGVRVRVAIPGSAAAPDTDWVILEAVSTTDSTVRDTVLGRARTVGGVAVEPGPALRFGLLPVVPTPASDRAVIRFVLPEACDGVLDVHDVSGARVRRLDQGGWRPGLHVVEWAGDDAAGRRVGAGVYFLRLTAGARRAVGRVVVVR